MILPDLVSFPFAKQVAAAPDSEAVPLGLQIVFSADETIDTEDVFTPVFAPAASAASTLDGIQVWNQGQMVRDQQPYFGHFYPRFLGKICLRVVAMTLAARLREVMRQIDEIEEEEGLEEGRIDPENIYLPSRHRHDLSIWQNFGVKLRFGVFRDLSIITIQRTYELICFNFVSPKMKKSLVKNLVASATRKAKRYSSKLVVANKMIPCAIRGQMMYWLAVFTFREAVDAYETYHKKSSFGIEHNGTFLNRLKNNAIQCTIMCLLSGVGAGVGSSVRPGLGTGFGVMIGPFFAPLVLLSLHKTFSL
mmetsp:Transcript_8749/g.10005  ORF Transcript_8749/g.10005 Transcript_8749/m.10005 type:complete len:306 (+) Transcript_8749:344-1261(+)